MLPTPEGRPGKEGLGSLRRCPRGCRVLQAPLVTGTACGAQLLGSKDTLMDGAELRGETQVLLSLARTSNYYIYMDINTRFYIYIIYFYLWVR